MAVTMTVSPRSRAWRQAPARAVLTDLESASANTRSVSTPPPISVASCASRSWPVVLTLAQPRIAIAGASPDSLRRSGFDTKPP